MTPYEKALEVYHREPCARTFGEDLALHLMHGFVFSTPEYFVMGRPVKSEAHRSLVVNPGFTWDRQDCDCWHVYLMAGDMGQAWKCLPWRLPLISLERRNELRFYKLTDVERFVSIP